jgi:dihydropteroate synthase
MTASVGQDQRTGEPEAPGPFSSWVIRGGEIDLSLPLVMGILNLTPDSFSDGGQFAHEGAALERAEALFSAGAGILDLGGESTRPGAEAVPVEEEMNRVLPLVQRLAESGMGPISVDTRNADVAREALRAGAHVVNDVSALNHDPRMAEVVAEEGAGLVLSHMRGTPATMRQLADYRDVTAEVTTELGQSKALALASGIPEERIVVDPGIGFAKTGAQSLELLRNLASLQRLECPILVGPSRKSFIGELTGRPPDERLPGTVAACVLALRNGAAIFRVHDVAPVVQALEVARGILGPVESGPESSES